MARTRESLFTLADLIDYELQVSLDSTSRSNPLPRLEADSLQLGKIASLRAWLQQVRGDAGERFVQLRFLITLILITTGAILGWTTIKALLKFEKESPINVLYFIAAYVLVPLLFFLILACKDLMLRFLGRLPSGWISSGINKLLEWVLKKKAKDTTAIDAWRRLQTLHPQIFTLQAWVLSQLFALSYYATSTLTLLFMVTVNDYAFSWQTTLKIGPHVLTEIIHGISQPFAWLVPSIVPSLDLIQATQFDRFSGRYVNPRGSEMAGSWWPFLLALILVYGLLPRLILALVFQLRLTHHLRKLPFNDFASEDLWLRLQKTGLNWEGEAGTPKESPSSDDASIAFSVVEPLLVVRWRQAPFQDADLQKYFQTRGFKLGSIIDAVGRENDVKTILESLKSGQSMVVVSESWEMPGEAFNQLRLAIRKNISTRTLILFVPMDYTENGLRDLHNDQDVNIWQHGLKAFKDPYVGLLYHGA